MTNLDNFGHNPTQQDIQPIQPNPEKSTAQGAPSPLKLQPRREQRWDLHDGCIRAIISWSPHGRFLVGVGVRKSKTQSPRVWQIIGELFLSFFVCERKIGGFGWSINLSVSEKTLFLCLILLQQFLTLYGYVQNTWMTSENLPPTKKHHHQHPSDTFMDSSGF